MSKVSKIAASLAFVPVVAMSGSAFAGSPGQLAGGDNYLVKNVTKGGAYANNVSAACNEELQYSMQISNTQFGALNNVTLTATLPGNGGTSTATVTTDLGGTSGTSDTASVTLPAGATQSVNGSAVLYDDKTNVLNANLGDVTKGVNIGTLAGSTTKYVNFKAKVNCPVVENPVYSCDAFSITADANRKVKVTALNTTAKNGAVYKSADLNFGDNSAVVSVANAVGQEHQYATDKDGTYTITATAHFDVNGADKTASGPNCVQQVTFKGNDQPKIEKPGTPATPAATPAAPTTLVNTGAGSVAAMFAAATAAGAVAYRKLLARRLSQ